MVVASVIVVRLILLFGSDNDTVLPSLRVYVKPPGVAIVKPVVTDDCIQDLNLSSGGIYLATKEPLPPGSMVVLRMNLPKLDNAVEVLGEVVWNNVDPEKKNGLPNGMGIKFLSMNSLIQEHIGLFHAGKVGNS